MEILFILGGLLGLLVLVVLAMTAITMINALLGGDNLEYLEDEYDSKDTRTPAPLLGVVRPRKQDWND